MIIFGNTYFEKKSLFLQIFFLEITIKNKSQLLEKIKI